MTGTLRAARAIAIDLGSLPVTCLEVALTCTDMRLERRHNHAGSAANISLASRSQIKVEP